MNKLYEETDIQGIANAIRAKNGSSDTYKVSEMATAIANIPSGGSIIIDNATVEQYYSHSGTIDPYKYVKINMAYEFPHASTGSEFFQYQYISENKILILYVYDYRLYAVIGNIDSTTKQISFSEAQTINTTKWTTSMRRLMSFTLNDGRIVAFVVSTTSTLNSNYFFKAYILSVTNDVVSADAVVDVPYGTTRLGYNYMDLKLIDTNKVLIACDTGTANTLASVVMTVSGNTIELGTVLVIANASNTGYNTCVSKIDTNKAFISHRNGNYIFGVVVSVSGTIITSGTDTQLGVKSGAYTYSKNMSYSTNKILETYVNNTLRVLPISITDLAITIDSEVEIFASSYSAYYNYIQYISSTKFAVFHAYDSSRYLGVTICNIVNGAVTVSANNTHTQISEITSSYMYPVSTPYNSSNTNMFVVNHKNGNGGVRQYELIQVQNDDSVNVSKSITVATTALDGLLTTQATTSTVGNVSVLSSS